MEQTFEVAEVEREAADRTSRLVLDAAFKVHSKLGPGLLESAYRVCLEYELRKLGCQVQSEVPLPVTYEAVKLDVGYRLDLAVYDCVIVELKSVETIAPIHKAQLLSYMKLSGKNLGLLINFNVLHLREGVSRFVRGAGWKRTSS